MKKFLLHIFAFIGFAVTVAVIALEVYVWLTYGSAPAGDVPTWALYLMPPQKAPTKEARK